MEEQRFCTILGKEVWAMLINFKCGVNMMKALCGMLLAMGLLFSIANITTEGGNVTELGLNASINSTYWDGFYGDVVLGAGATYTESVIGNNVSLLNMIAQDPPCTYSSISMHVIAANASSISLPLAAGNLAILDGMILDGENGSSTFTSTSSFTLNSGTYNNVPSLYTLANGMPSAYFREGYLNGANGNLVFVAVVADNRPNWQGGTSDYQVMLPNNGSSMQYWLWVDVNYTCVGPTPPGPSGGKDHELFIPPMGTYEVAVGETFDADVIVRNRGDYTEWNIVVFVDNCPAGFTCESVNITKIKEGEEEEAWVPITAGAVGEYVLTICAESEDTEYCRDFILNVLPECVADEDCAEDEYCDGGMCEAQKEIGDTCNSDGECTSGVCVEGICAFCETDGDCDASEECSGGSCKKVECPCGVVENHVCIPYECCADEDCKVDEFCIDFECVKREMELILIDGNKIEGETGFFQVVNNKGEEIGGARVFTDYVEALTDDNGYAHLGFPYNGIIYAYADGYGQIARLYDVTKLGFITLDVDFALVGQETILVVKDSRGNPVPGVTLTIEGQKFVTDDNGEVLYTFGSPGLKEIKASKPGYLIRDTEIPVDLVSPAELGGACGFPILLNWVELSGDNLSSLWLISVVLGIFNFLIFRRRMRGDLLEKLLREKKHDYEAVIRSKEREQLIKSLVYSFGPLILAIPNFGILSICFMSNVVILQAIAEIIIVIKTISTKKP